MIHSESIFLKKRIPNHKFFSMDTFFDDFKAKYKENSTKRGSKIKKNLYRPTSGKIIIVDAKDYVLLP